MAINLLLAELVTGFCRLLSDSSDKKLVSTLLSLDIVCKFLNLLAIGLVSFFVSMGVEFLEIVAKKASLLFSIERLAWRFLLS